MGRQIGFYAADRDHADLLRLFEQAGLRAVPSLVPTDEIPKPVPVEEADLVHSRFCHLIPSDIPPVEVFYQQSSSEPAVSVLMSWVSPVIEFTPSPVRSGEVHEGRIYFDARPNVVYYDRVKKLYEKLARYIGKWPKAEFNFHIGPNTLAAAKSGHLRLLHGAKPLALE